MISFDISDLLLASALTRLQLHGWKEMIGVLVHDSTLYGYTGPGTTWASEMNFVMNHAPGTGSIARPVDQQSRALPLYHGMVFRYGNNEVN